MSHGGQPGEEDGAELGSRNPVTGTVPRRDRSRASRRDRMGRAAVLASRRDAALRVLMEAYRRDVGPGSFDTR
jgi:hypothetical protein